MIDIIVGESVARGAPVQGGLERIEQDIVRQVLEAITALAQNVLADIEQHGIAKGQTTKEIDKAKRLWLHDQLGRVEDERARQLIIDALTEIGAIHHGP